jgi:acetylornithine/succinyldiaminopimelate/putrescine aminotransferase
VIPDVMTLAKGLGGGVPIGAIACTEKAAAGLAAQPGGAVPHASTFGGNPLAAAACNAVFQILEEDKLVERVATSGTYLAEKLTATFPNLEIRGRGLLRGVVVNGSPVTVVGKCRENGLLLSVAGDKVVRFAPAYTVDHSQLDEAIEILRNVLASL